MVTETESKKIAAILKSSGSKIKTLVNFIEKGKEDPTQAGQIGLLGRKVEKIAPAIAKLAEDLQAGRGNYVEKGRLIGYQVPDKNISVLYSPDEGTAKFTPETSFWELWK